MNGTCYATGPLCLHDNGAHDLVSSNSSEHSLWLYGQLEHGCAVEELDKALSMGRAAQLQALRRAESRRGTTATNSEPIATSPVVSPPHNFAASDNTMPVQGYLVSAAGNFSDAASFASRCRSEVRAN